MQSWLGTFGGAGNGDYRGEMLRAIAAITSLAQAWSIPLSRILIRLDGLYGNVALLIDLLTSGLGVVVRGRDYTFLDLPSVQAALSLPPDALITHPESGVHRALYDCPGIALTPTGIVIRMIVAVHPSLATRDPIGVTKNGLVYEIFFTSAPKEAFTPSDVLHLYLHRGAFETALAGRQIWNRTRTDGFLTAHGDRNAGRSSPNGSGTCVWNWDSTSRLPPCA
jgi:hypothetical protein